jgi:hypothetical protein
MIISKFLRDFSRLFVKYIRFEKEPTIPDLSRVLYWNEEDLTFSFSLDQGSHEIGQEIDPVLRNQSGIDLKDLDFVMRDGAIGQSGKIKIKKAITDGTYPADTPDRTHLYFDIGNISIPTLSIDANLKTRFKRLATTGAAPSNDPFFEMLGIHIEEDTMGSREERTK